MICYGGSSYYNGGEWIKIEEGSWLEAGETVSMIVYVPTCTITWKRNGSVKAQQQFKKLQNTKIEWLPWILLPSVSSVDLLEEAWT